MYSLARDYGWARGESRARHHHRSSLRQVSWTGHACIVRLPIKHSNVSLTFGVYACMVLGASVLSAWVPPVSSAIASRGRNIPHSVLPLPAQRPARGSSPARMRDVHEKQPSEVKPLASRGWGGRAFSAKYRAMSALLQSYSGLMTVAPLGPVSRGKMSRLVSL